MKLEFGAFFLLLSKGTLTCGKRDNGMGKRNSGRSEVRLNYQYGDADCFPTCLLNAFLTILGPRESTPAEVIKQVWSASMDEPTGT
jgi:hypothetical protein